MDENKSKGKGLSIAMILLAIVIGFGFVIGLTQTSGAQNLNNTKTEISNYTFDENGNLLSYGGEMTDIVIPTTYSLAGTSEERKITSSSLYNVVDQARNLGLTDFNVKNESGNRTDDFGNSYYEEKYSVTYTVKKTIEGNDYSVQYISSRAFQNNSKVKTVVIPENVKVIGDYAFYNCANLESVTLPEGLQTINNSAFYNCRKLSTINLPNSISLLSSNTFQNCDSITNITLPNSITEIHSSLFYECDGLTTITIPESVRFIYGQAFQYCRNLETVTFSSNLIYIDSYAFNGCSKLTTVDILASLDNIGYRAFYSCPMLQTIILRGSNVINIDTYAFPTTVSKIYVADEYFDYYMSNGMWSNYWTKLYRLSELV
ncbi:MAG: leucine-rich repeat domain-containing protein [Clostridia bacterium]|jgi:hypothetical protein|nr:leucine-rich repeat domain-containing protein [Clostridia bacterium]